MRNPRPFKICATCYGEMPCWKQLFCSGKCQREYPANKEKEIEKQLRERRFPYCLSCDLFLPRGSRKFCDDLCKINYEANKARLLAIPLSQSEEQEYTLGS